MEMTEDWRESDTETVVQLIQNSTDFRNAMKGLEIAIAVKAALAAIKGQYGAEMPNLSGNLSKVWDSALKSALHCRPVSDIDTYEDDPKPYDGPVSLEDKDQGW